MVYKSILVFTQTHLEGDPKSNKMLTKTNNSKTGAVSNKRNK